MRARILTFFLALLLLIPSGCGQSHTYFLLSVSTFSLWGANAAAAERAMTDFLRELESAIGLNNPESELSRLNAAAAGERVEFGKHTMEIWKRSLALCELTDGAFSPALEPLTLVWGFDSDRKRIPDEAERLAARELCGTKYFVTEENSVYKTVDGAKLDFGGIAKGYAADECCRIARNYGVQGFLNLGGNLYIVGTKQDGSEYRVGIQHPRGAQGTTFAALTVRDASVVTSGDYQNYFEQDGVRYCHIMDAVSGGPAQSDLMSVTLVDEDSCRADALGTALFVMGFDRAVAFAEEEGLSYFLIKRDGTFCTNLDYEPTGGAA